MFKQLENKRMCFVYIKEWEREREREREKYVFFIVFVCLDLGKWTINSMQGALISEKWAEKE